MRYLFTLKSVGYYMVETRKPWKMHKCIFKFCDLEDNQDLKFMKQYMRTFKIRIFFFMFLK